MEALLTIKCRLILFLPSIWSLAIWMLFLSKSYAQQVPFPIAKRIAPPSDSSLVAAKLENQKTVACFQRYEIKDRTCEGISIFTVADILPAYQHGTKRLIFDINFQQETIADITVPTITDSVDVFFYIDKKGRLFRSIDQTVRSLADSLIVERLKKLSCSWRPAVMSGRPVLCIQKYKFFYSLGMSSQGKPVLFVNRINEQKTDISDII
ncbi:hypothetical protein [Sphingobacterium sp. SYP-B4668]|uniref:hypothetical protein n=1 Tax=Sphingobacterium sp. SYP-B4668 TaxID=2996035 RepID=UPI0022DE875D|nr:hypothetical protein [Sphingobacterium sp. SYP-B4668]